MTQYQQEIELVQHYYDRMENKVEICDCEICGGEPISEVREWVSEVREYWSQVERDTH